MNSGCARFVSACSQWLDELGLKAARTLGINIKTFRLLAVALLIVALTGLSASQITGDAIKNDAVANLRLAFNFFRHGVLSLDANPPYLPSNAREPIPNLVAANHLRFLGLSQSNLSFSYLIQGHGAYILKLVNLYWVALGLLATTLLVKELVDSVALVMIVTTLVGVFFFAAPMFVDTLYTELHAAVVLLWTSFFLLKASTTGKKVYYILGGLCLGLLSLTKAIFFYITIALFPLLFLLLLFRVQRKRSIVFSFSSIMLLVASFFLAVTPWIMRNKLELGTTQIAQRGGRVLSARAMKNHMENNEIPGAIFFWGPSFYQHASRLLGFGALPQDFQRGGRYQRINREGSDFRQQDLEAEFLGHPQDAISYKRKNGAEITKLRLYAEAKGIANPERYSETVASQRAKAKIMANPLRHLVMTPLFLWRGIWAWPNQGVRIIKSNSSYVLLKDALALVSYVSLFVVFSLGMLRGNSRYLAITVMPVAMLLAYGLLTHNLPRYSTPAIPIMIISAAVLIKHQNSHSGLRGNGNKNLASSLASESAPD